MLVALASASMLGACSLVGNVGDLHAAKDGGGIDAAGGTTADGAAGSGGSAGAVEAGAGAAGCDAGADAGCKPAPACSPDNSPCTDDGNPCTTDICTSGVCQHTLLAVGEGCGNGKVCDSAGKCSAACGIDGKLYAADTKNPANPCEKCDPTTSPSAWTPLADNSPCTDDGNSCTKDVCASGICTHPDLSAGDSCGTGKVCDENLACSAGCFIGGVFFKDGTLDPSNSCESCDASKSTSGWTPLADATSCTDDGNPCTLDQCQSGKCTHPARPDTSPCGSGGHCQSGKCTATCLINGVSYPEGTLEPNNPCESCQSATNSTGWTPLADNTACGASSCGSYGGCGGFSSTCDTSGTKSRTCTDHVCKAGVCTAPTHMETAACSRTTDGNSCSSDGNACTGNTCSGGACTHPKLSGGTTCGSGKICDGNGSCVTGCWISGTLYATNALEPGNKCQSCQPATSTAKWTDLPSTTVCASTTCGSYGSCGGFSSTCAESGTQSRTCTDYTCNAGACTGANRTESQACTRNTDGVSCGNGFGCRVYVCSSGTCIVTTTCTGGDYCCPAGNCVPNSSYCKL